MPSSTPLTSVSSWSSAASLRRLGTFTADAANEPGQTVTGSVYLLPGVAPAVEALGEIERLEWIEPDCMDADLAPMLRDHVLPAVRDIRRIGAAAVDLCWVACGRLDGYYGHYWTQVFGLLYGSYPVVIAREAWQSAGCDVEVYLYAPQGTTQMRFSSDGGVTWSVWQAYATRSLRTLDGEGGGVARVLAESRDANGTVRQASDSFRLVNDCGLVSLNRVFRSGFD